MNTIMLMIRTLTQSLRFTAKICKDILYLPFSDAAPTGRQAAGKPKPHVLLARLTDRLNRIAPSLTPHPVGSASFGIHQAHDIDIFLPCHADDMDYYEPRINSLAGLPSKKRRSFIEWHFRYRGVPVDLKLIDDHAEEFRHQIIQAEAIQHDRTIRTAYMKLKRQSTGMHPFIYRLKRTVFFTRIAWRHRPKNGTHTLPRTAGQYHFVSELSDGNNKRLRLAIYRHADGNPYYAIIWTGERYGPQYHAFRDQIRQLRKAREQRKHRVFPNRQKRTFMPVLEDVFEQPGSTIVCIHAPAIYGKQTKEFMTNYFSFLTDISGQTPIRTDSPPGTAQYPGNPRLSGLLGLPAWRTIAGRILQTGRSVLYRGPVAVILVSACILAVSIRGTPGIPAEEQLQEPYWTNEGPFELSPERGRYALTYSIIENRSVHFTLPLARFVLPDLGYVNGIYVSLFAPGVSYLVAPGYLIGKIAGAPQVGTFAIIALFALANAVLIYAIVRKLGMPGEAASAASLVFLFATPAYAYAVTLYQHHISVFIILLSVYLLLMPPNVFTLGSIWFLCAASIPIDYPNLFLMFPIGLAAATNTIRVRRNGESAVIGMETGRLVAVGCAVLPLLFFLWFNKASYGNPLQFSGTVSSVREIGSDGIPLRTDTGDSTGTQKSEDEESGKTATGFFRTRNLINGLYTHIISPDRGIAYFAPVLFLAIPGLVALTTQAALTGQILISIIAANVILYSLWGDPWGGWAFGSRYLIPAYAVSAIGIGYALGTHRKRILFLIVFIVLFSYSAYVNASGALTTNANPPKIETAALEQVTGRRERYSFDRNLETLAHGTSKSFAYTVWFSRFITPRQFHAVTSALIIAMGVIMVGVLYTKNERRNT